MQDRPAEGEEHVESGTAPQGMERAMENNTNQTATPGRPAQTAETMSQRTSGRETKLPSHLKDFIIDRPLKKNNLEFTVHIELLEKERCNDK